MKKLTEKEINDLAYQKAGSTSWCDSFSYSEGMKDLQKILFGSASPPIEVSKEENCKCSDSWKLENGRCRRCDKFVNTEESKKGLSRITDEDAIEVAKIVFGTNSFTYSTKDLIIHGQNMAQGIFKPDYTIQPTRAIKIYNFLQTHNYNLSI